MQNEYIDLPINIQQTPKLLLEKAPQYKVPEKPEDAANQILKTLQTLIKGSPNDLYIFYQTALPSTHKKHFIDKQWPSSDALEQLFDTEYKPGARSIYKEFAIRTTWNKIKYQKDADKYCDAIDQAWEEYTSIFKLQWTRINFPADMIWDYFDSFLQFYFLHQTKAASVSQSKKYNSECFDGQMTKNMLKQICLSLPLNFNQNCTSKQIFAYYSLVALAHISVAQENYKQALAHISKISLKQTSILSKGMGSLLTIFFVAALSYFMLEQCYKSVKLCQTIVPFYHKYRKFFDKSLNYSNQLQPMYEKLVILQCINYIFLQQKPKTTVMQIFKNTNVKTKQKEARDRISDCFLKLKQNDSITFWRLFNFLSVDYCSPNLQKIVTERFRKLQSVNINTIIQNYKRIQLQKIAKMLGISTDEVLKQFKSFGAVQKTETSWDLTILNPLLKQKKKVNVVIEGNVAIFDSQTVDVQQSTRQWQRYREQIAWLNEKVKAI